MRTLTLVTAVLLSSLCPGDWMAPSEAVAGSLVFAGQMSTARAAQTATPLSDGRVLIAGGMTGSEGHLGDAELFDPASGGFDPTRGMRTLRQSHTATLLSDGKVLIAGGYDAHGTYLSSAEIYDPESNSFAPAQPMSAGRAGHVAVRLRDGRVLLVGGVGEGWTFLATAEIYDPLTGAFAPTGSMSNSRESHVGVALADGRVLIIGGHTGRGSNIKLYASTEIFDPSTGTFAGGPSMAMRRHKHDAALIPGNLVLVTGGADERDDRGQYGSAEILDPISGVTTPVRPMHRTRYKHAGTSVTLLDGRILVAGGATEAEVYDPTSRTFMLVESAAKMAGQFSASALLPDGRVLITGGYGNGKGPQSSAWLFAP